ncbi:lipopolysaccharide biosynthesis protein [Serpentinicella alkaliphila]|uniref:PST family polysaccharide transporter n=1 Tax=Serpentinicella alkaliphila TaxID=1734049 RepID=A0A4R2TTH0_9FIRM|nr:lipopolysaccharide biosynthesis protein [Serpentinicella alkaliphila]QUH25038.1 lipopolysaccharide biosynthesis protein [Serpentinicella alkaliphila]TCP98402.1 PST family polysaccharide transporter [Serpentinicella alkaliphila]
MKISNGDYTKVAITAAKWSTASEIVAKLVSPLTNMILARIMSPEIFGVIATITMITSFADVFIDTGFQRFLVQHNFNSKDELYKNSNVAFYTNIILSILLWGIISLFNNELASILGVSGIGAAIIVACAQLPITSFSSIQMALFRRNFDFRILFIVRVISIIIPIFVTIPLALMGKSYWSIICGTLIMHFISAIVLTIKSEWKPKLFYNFNILKNMFTFTIWSIVESISIWLTTWVDAFIIASVLNDYYLGIYKTSTTMVNSIMALITATIVPVLFSTLSRLQDDKTKFNETFFLVQRVVAIIVFPLGVGIFLYSDLATNILLGSQWAEASNVIGTWALTSSIVIVFSYFCSEVYRSKGKPKLSFISQILHLIILIPACIISSKFGFWTLVYIRSWIRLQSTLVHFILMKKFIQFPIMNSFSNVMPSVVSTSIMFFVGNYLIQISDSLTWSLVSILICIIVYILVLLRFKLVKTDIKNFLTYR